MNLRIGIDSYSLRFQGFSLGRVFDKCLELGAETISLDLEQFEPRDDAELDWIAQRADAAGVSVIASGPPLITVTANSSLTSTPLEKFDRCFARTRRLSGGLVRTFISYHGAGTADIRHLLELARTQLQRVIAMSANYGIKVVVENHQDLRSRDLIELVSVFDFDSCAVCFDFRNQVPVVESPLDALAVLKSRVTLCHVNDVALRIVPNGFVWKAVPLGIGSLPLDEMISICVQAGVKDFVLEISTSRSPVFTPLSSDGADTDVVERRFVEFLRKHERWPDELDAYVSRGIDELNSVARQEQRHLERSVSWIKTATATLAGWSGR